MYKTNKVNVLKALAIGVLALTAGTKNAEIKTSPPIKEALPDDVLTDQQFQALLDDKTIELVDANAFAGAAGEASAAASSGSDPPGAKTPIRKAQAT